VFARLRSRVKPVLATVAQHQEVNERQLVNLPRA
jgi:hypothetical protein